MAVQYNNRLRGRTVMVLPASCPHSVVVTMGNCRHKIKQRASRANELLAQGHVRDLQPENQSPRRSPLTNDLCIRRCRAQPNDVTPVNISDE